MKAEEIKPGDILYEKERKLLVKVARVDEDGVVKCSAYTDMGRIFKTVPPPYRIGTHTADAYIPATDDQRKYMERNLAVCKYVNLPKNNRMETLAYIISDLKAENMALRQNMQNISSEFADVLCRLNEKEQRMNDGSSTQTFVDLRQMREQYDKLEGEYKKLKFLAKGIHAFVKEKSLYIKKDDECPYCRRGITACSPYCRECGSCLDVIEPHGVICERRLKEANVSLPDND